jgi:hypothetical protein
LIVQASGNTEHSYSTTFNPNGSREYQWT